MEIDLDKPLTDEAFNHLAKAFAHKAGLGPHPGKPPKEKKGPGGVESAGSPRKLE